MIADDHVERMPDGPANLPGAKLRKLQRLANDSGLGVAFGDRAGPCGATRASAGHSAYTVGLFRLVGAGTAPVWPIRECAWACFGAGADRAPAAAPAHTANSCWGAAIRKAARRRFRAAGGRAGNRVAAMPRQERAHRPSRYGHPARPALASASVVGGWGCGHRPDMGNAQRGGFDAPASGKAAGSN